MTALLLTLLACYGEHAFIEDLAAEYCPALFTCYEILEADCSTVQCLYPNKAACDADMDSRFEGGTGACRDGERFVGSSGEACIADLATLDCTEMASGKLPRSCNDACQ